MRLFAAFALAVLSPVAIFSQPASWDLLQPKAGMVLGIEWKKLMASPLRETLSSKMQESGLPLPADSKAIQDFILNGIDSILIGAPPEAIASGGSKPPFL